MSELKYYDREYTSKVCYVCRDLWLELDKVSNKNAELEHARFERDEYLDRLTEIRQKLAKVEAENERLKGFELNFLALKPKFEDCEKANEILRKQVEALTRNKGVI